MIQMTHLQNRNQLTDFETKIMVTKGEIWRGEGWIGVWDWHIHTIIYGMDECVYNTRNSA